MKSLPRLNKIYRDAYTVEHLLNLANEGRAIIPGKDMLSEADLTELSAARYSAWIESVLLCVPVRPMGALVENDGSFTLYCNTDMLMALYLFYTGQLRLTGMRYAKELEGKMYKDLLPILQNRFDDTLVQVQHFQLSKDVPEIQIKIFKESL